MADTRSEIQTSDYLKDIENIIENLGLEIIATKNFDNNQALETQFESYVYEIFRPAYLT